jgi:DMSO/TMAO reductase YedYZ molybdopterin-dependent catalytic subunit
MHPRARNFVLLVAALTFASTASLQMRGQAPASRVAVTPAQLQVAGDVTTPLTLTVADLKKMPRKTITVMNPHDKKTETYEGVLLEDLLHRAGALQGEQLRGLALSMYVVAEATDGYRVVFSLAELDSSISESDVLVADAMDDAPLPAPLGPFRLVAPHDKRPARWVRMLKSITVVRALPTP